MSETEHRRWKLIPQLDKNESIEDWCLRILKEKEKRTDATNYEDDIKELFRDELLDKYYLWEKEIYLTDCERIDESDDICTAKQLDNWDIEVELKRYNWGASINEMIEQALSEM